MEVPEWDLPDRPDSGELDDVAYERWREERKERERSE